MTKVKMCHYSQGYIVWSRALEVKKRVEKFKRIDYKKVTTKTFQLNYYANIKITSFTILLDNNGRVHAVL
jgi:hypothetical protein